MAKRTYTDNEKATALAALDANGGNLSKTSMQTKVPLNTLAGWAKNRFVSSDVTDIRNEKKRELSLELEDLAYTLAGVMPHFAHSPFNKISDLSTALGTVIDKMRLLRGESTNITETRTEDKEWAESQITELMKEFKLSRTEAIKLAKTHAPTIAKWLM